MGAMAQSDLWHQWKGGETDGLFIPQCRLQNIFAYDPWYAGGYINYYYYGQVLVGMPVKALGIVPAVAYSMFAIMVSLLATGTLALEFK